MKLLMSFSIWITVLFSHSLFAQELPVLSKTPKSLFLIKKAKIDNDVGEPVIYPGEKQSKLLIHEKIFNKYRLQILDSQKNDWGSTR